MKYKVNLMAIFWIRKSVNPVTIIISQYFRNSDLPINVTAPAKATSWVGFYEFVKRHTFTSRLHIYWWIFKFNTSKNNSWNQLSLSCCISKSIYKSWARKVKAWRLVDVSKSIQLPAFAQCGHKRCVYYVWKY